MVFLFLIPKGNKQDRLVGKFFDKVESSILTEIIHPLIIPYI